MMDALLFAVRDRVENAQLGYIVPGTMNIMGDQRPASGMGAIFLSISVGQVLDGESEARNKDNSLDDDFAYEMTLTMRVQVPFDKIGDSQLAVKLARKTGFNRKCEDLVALAHMDWEAIAKANQYMLQWLGEDKDVWGFCEPARFRRIEVPHFVTGEWFSAAPEAKDVGLAAAMSFSGARRIQPIGSFT